MSTDLSELTCPDCGAREQREAFCNSCGAALSRAKPVPAAGAAGATAFDEPEREPEPEPAENLVASQVSSALEAHTSQGSKTDLRSKTGTLVGSFADLVAASDADTAASASASAPTQPAPASAAADVTDADPRAVADESDTVPLPDVALAESKKIEREQQAAAHQERARALLVPVADSSAPSGIVPVLPGVPDPQAPQRNRAEDLEDLDAGIQCQWCGTRNPPERHFCRRCGQRMAYAPVEAKRPSWWRRIIFFWRNRPLPFAGQRPRLRRGPGGVIRPLVWGVVLVVLIVVVVREFSPASKNVRDHFAKPNEVSNWTIAASHQDPDHAAKLLHDTYSDTWWGSGFSPQNTNGTTLTVTFTQPVNLLDMGITPGAGTAADTFGVQGSPETVDAELIPIPGKGAPIKKTFTLDDQPGFQKFQLRGDDVSQVVLTITSSYSPTSPNADAKKVESAISELEFYTRH